MLEAGAHAATDMTGFGLLGHAAEMARASRVTVEIALDRVPLLPEATHLQSKAYRTCGVQANRGYVGELLEIREEIGRDGLDLLLDPQTSGGLLVSLPETNQGAFARP